MSKQTQKESLQEVSKKNGGPYTEKQREERRDKVFELHFDWLEFIESNKKNY